MPLDYQTPQRIDLESPAFKADPHPTYAGMRDLGPVVPIKMRFFGTVWMTTTHDTAKSMLKDADSFVQEARNAGGKGGMAGLRWWMPRSLKLMANNMLGKDDPDHRRLRKLVDQAFARRGIQDMRPKIEATADRLLDDLRPGDDLLERYARRLPLEVISDMMGLPEEERQAFLAASRRALDINSPLGLMRAMRAFSGLAKLLGRQIEAQRSAPRDGLIADLIRAEEDGDRLVDNELISMIFLLLVAGFETTTHLITTSVIALERHPDQKAWLLEDFDTRREPAVEELARFMSPVQMTKPRQVARDMEFFGQPMKQRQLVIAQLAAANYDPEVFDAPDQLRLDRFPNPHMVFGSGKHFCLGMQLARVEAQAALQRLYDRFPSLGIPARPDWNTRIGLRGVTRLPVSLAG